MIECWRAIPGYEGSYEVSDLGRVRSLPRLDSLGHKRQGVLLSQKVGFQGYRHVSLSQRGKIRHFKVPTLVMIAFVGIRPAGMVCCHRDDNKANNTLGNLRWDTPASNSLDAIRNGKALLGHRHPNAVHSDSLVERARDIRRITGYNPKRIAEWLGIPWQTVSDYVYMSARLT